jgi:Rieske Fe-S protein
VLAARGTRDHAAHYARYLIEITPASQLAPGEAKVLEVDGHKLAVHRDDGGALHAVSPVCTHMGCLVEFNRAERTWDCPCHGSRFAIDGDVVQGPAKRPLAPKHAPDEASAEASSSQARGQI